MSNGAKIIAVAGLVVVVVLGVVGFRVLQTPEPASAPIEAIPLSTEVAAATVDVTTTQPTATTGTVVAETTPDPATASTAAPATAAATETAVVMTTADATTTAGGTSAAILARIVPDESEVRFVIDEVLNNAPKTVIGTTNQVAGELSVDPANPANTRVGVIQVNARTLTTDNDFRNRAIKNAILETDTYEFITFTPTAITGLPESGAVGQSYSFQIAGDLTIKDVTRQVTFEVTANPVSETPLEGSATATIRYADYGITIPQVRSVASVEDEVRLELDFVATPVS